MGQKMQYPALCVKTFLNLWRNWAIAFGSIVLLIVLSMFVPRQFMPIVALAEAYLLNVLVRIDVSSPNFGCVLCVRVATQTLFWSAVVMFAVNILNMPWAIREFFESIGFSSNAPMLVSPIVFPILLVLSTVTLMIGNESRFCRRCRQRYGSYEEEGVMSLLFWREARYQLILMMIISAIVTAVSWWYFLIFYINVNLNSPDKFFLIYMPAAIYLISLALMAVRNYQTLYVLNSVSVSGVLPGTKTVVRFLVINNDALLMTANADGLMDTPIVKQLSENIDVSDNIADKIFGDLTGIKNSKLKYLFTNGGFRAGADVDHFAVFVDNDGAAKLAKNDRIWSSLDEIDRCQKASRMSPQLSHELYRIFTITMAWKTYDKSGHRLYPIKNYRPTFRLRDLANWQVNYNDLGWIQVSRNNEDKKFFHIRKIWKKIF